MRSILVSNWGFSLFGILYEEKQKPTKAYDGIFLVIYLTDIIESKNRVPINIH